MVGFDLLEQGSLLRPFFRSTPEPGLRIGAGFRVHPKRFFGAGIEFGRWRVRDRGPLAGGRGTTGLVVAAIARGRRRGRLGLDRVAFARSRWGLESAIGRVSGGHGVRGGRGHWERVLGRGRASNDAAPAAALTTGRILLILFEIVNVFLGGVAPFG